MKAVHFDSNGAEIEAHNVTGCTVGFASWRRMVEIFRAANELRPGETLKSFQVDDRGITFRVD